MRFDGMILGLLSCWISLSAAEQFSSTTSSTTSQNTDTGSPSIESSNTIVSLTTTLPTPAAYNVNNGDVTFPYAPVSYVQVKTVNLKVYGLADSSIDADVTIGTGQVQLDTAGGSGGGGGTSKSKGSAAGVANLHRRAVTLTATANTVIVPWLSDRVELQTRAGSQLYLEFVWGNDTYSGSSTSPLFGFFDNATTENTLDTLLDAHSNANAPARGETSIPNSSPGLQTQTSSSTTPSATTSPSSSNTASSSPSPGGLNRSGVIGVAVGVAVAGLLIAGVLTWLFCFRRRRNNNKLAVHQHADSEGYGTDSGRHGMMMADKELPHAAESAHNSSYGGGDAAPLGAGVHGSEDPYAPYSDRPMTPPEQQNLHVGSATPTGGVGAANSTTDLTSTRGTPTPTPAINARYAHLVEEGMTEDEIRQLEEEERHLDAAIEHAGGR
ncbi:hypothetical protein F5Y16DRAFT_369433 [Xylariaceae sp. FL0255]|nr:hypothetical protein F5Y16DRAFT_369433 [Xylariaceae sp. FL0255]